MYNAPDQRPPQQPPPYYYAPNPAPSYPPAAAIAQPAPAPDAIARARAAGIALLGSTGLLLVAALSKAWFTAGSGGVGLLGLERCRRGLCETATWFDINRVPAQIPIFATTALIASLVAVAFLIHTGVLLLQNRVESIKLKWVQQLLGLTTFGASAFVFSLSVGEWSRGLTIGWSTFAGFAGLIAASIVTATMVRPLAKR
jgi:hypothetical protein